MICPGLGKSCNHLGQETSIFLLFFNILPLENTVEKLKYFISLSYHTAFQQKKKLSDLLWLQKKGLGFIIIHVWKILWIGQKICKGCSRGYQGCLEKQLPLTQSLPHFKQMFLPPFWIICTKLVTWPHPNSHNLNKKLLREVQVFCPFWPFFFTLQDQRR